MSYLRRLRELDYSRSLATPAASRVVLLTGQSSFRSSRLTNDQLTLLRTVANATPLELGFPFHPAFDVAEPVPAMVAASVRNALQFMWTLRPQPVFARALQPLITNTRESLYIVTGSCGLQILNSAWPFLERPAALKLQIVAIGPAAWQNRLRVVAIRGRRDPWSRLLYRGPITHSCDCGHLDYWSSPEVHELVRNACA